MASLWFKEWARDSGEKASWRSYEERGGSKGSLPEKKENELKQSKRA